MKISQKSFGILVIIFLGLTPLTWLREGYIIAKGDYFPFWFNPQITLSSDVCLWASHNMGNPNTMSSFSIYEILWLSVRSLGLDVGFIQILFQIYFFLGAGLSMYYLSKTVYPRLKLSPLISSIFYMFNFFVLQSRLSDGMAWTYTFLPLLMALLINIIKAAHQQNGKTPSKTIIYFAITSTIALSFASINPANVVIVLLVLVITLLYYLITQRNKIRPSLLNIAKLTAISTFLNLWWTIPILNYFLWSPLLPSPEVSATALSWTHSRASFLNLFWLNGVWGWHPNYFPYYDAYSNPILIILTFGPFLLAAAALLFKTRRSLFNAYLMFAILAFLFFAKGLREPLSQLNFFLYAYIPGTAMFREPTSKFTMAVMPFLALLVGYAAHHIANAHIGKHKSTNLTKIVVVTSFILVFVVGAYPLITNPIETRTAQLPFSSYIKIPEYWDEATAWLNSQPGDYKILITPPDDFYLMPYTWGYYGTDDFLTRIIQKPILSTYYPSYKLNPDTATTLLHLDRTLKYNKTNEFEALLALLNIRYILQRNDIQFDFAGRNIIPPNEMRTFLTQQPYIRLTQKFGELDIYEYLDPKPYIFTLSPTTLQQTTIRIENISTLDHLWDFTSQKDLQEWQNTTQQNQFGANQTLTLDNGALKAELWNSTWGWKSINSPLISSEYGNIYQIELDTKGENASQVHIKTFELDADKNIVAGAYNSFVGDGMFDWKRISFNYEPTNKTTKYLQIQIWHGHETKKFFPNTICVDNVGIHGYTPKLNTTGFNLVFKNRTQNNPATILSFKKVNPTKIVATINARQPFVLAVSEALDRSWVAFANRKQFRPTSLYLGLRGFYINQTGLLEITIEYEPQKWFYIGSAISLTTFFFSVVYITYSWFRTKMSECPLTSEKSRIFQS